MRRLELTLILVEDEDGTWRARWEPIRVNAWAGGLAEAAFEAGDALADWLVDLDDDELDALGRGERCLGVENGQDCGGMACRWNHVPRWPLRGEQ